MCSNENILLDLISALSFDEYVLIDCLKFNKTIKDDYSCYGALDFIAYTKQGYLNILDELVKIFGKNSSFSLFDNQIVIEKDSFIFVIKYTDYDINYLINLPGLDFYKCYYDGVKMHCTLKAVQCYKFKKVQYNKEINLVPVVVKCIYEHSGLIYKNDFWKETNIKYMRTMRDGYLIFDPNGIEPEKTYYNMSYFPTRSSIENKKVKFGSKYIFTLCGLEFDINKETVRDYLEEYIFKNPISTLC
jgi:hypothetical protein